MKTDDVIELGRALGLQFNEKTNFPDALAQGRVVFDGINGQRFLIESTWKDKEIHHELGRACMLYGRRILKMELDRLLAITND